MYFRTTCDWDEGFWDALEGVYKQSFTYGRKSRYIVKKLLNQGQGCLHVGIEGSEVIAMALTANLGDLNALLIDYFGVRKNQRSQGIGTQFVSYIKNWAMDTGYSGIVIEVASDFGKPADHQNVRRVRFWQKCGFQITDYLHQYKGVYELYRAGYLNLTPQSNLPKTGEVLFGYITQYHGMAWGWTHKFKHEERRF